MRDPLESSPRRKRVANVVFAGILVATALGFLWVEHRHGLTFPVPWPDEGSFLWPALAFRDRFSLFSPEISPAREIFWMPPGFMVLEGILFKVWTFSLLRARFISALFVLLAMVCLAIRARTPRARLGHALLVAVFTFAPIVQMVGNTSRMESLVLLLSALGLLLLERGRSAGLGVLAAAPLVHPNGIFPALGGFVYWAFAFRGRRRPTRTDVVAFAAAGLFWLLYAVHLLRNRAAFMEDMTAQFRWKQAEAALNGTLSTRATDPFLLALLAVLALAYVGARYGRVSVGGLAAFALAFFAISAVAVGWLYDVYAAFAALLVAMLVLEVAIAFAERFAPKWSVALSVAAALTIGGGSQFVTRHPYLMRSVTRATTATTLPGSGYISDAEHAYVAAFIEKAIRKDGPVVVQFLPDADSLLFCEMRSPSVKLLQQTYFSTNPDVYILHDSPWFPPFLRDVELADFAMRNRVNRPIGDWDLVAYSSRGGRWIAVQHDGPGRPWY